MSTAFFIYQITERGYGQVEVIRLDTTTFILTTTDTYLRRKLYNMERLIIG